MMRRTVWGWRSRWVAIWGMVKPRWDRRIISNRSRSRGVSLPNGNTLIGEGNSGRLFKVTGDGHVGGHPIKVKRSAGRLSPSGQLSPVTAAPSVPPHWLQLNGTILLYMP